MKPLFATVLLLSALGLHSANAADPPASARQQHYVTVEQFRRWQHEQVALEQQRERDNVDRFNRATGTLKTCSGGRCW